MAVSTRLIRGRIKSITNTRKITKAMELVAAAKMRKSVASTLATRPYATRASEMLALIAESGHPPRHPLLAVRKPKKILLIFVTSNKGLCGGYNANIIRHTAAALTDHDDIMSVRVRGKRIFSHPPPAIPPPSVKGEEKGGGSGAIEVITIGRKGERAVAKLGLKIIASFVQMADVPRFDEIRPVAQTALEGFAKKEYDKVAIAYTDFASAVRQEPKIRQLLPITSHELEKMLSRLAPSRTHAERTQTDADLTRNFAESSVENQSFIFEPSPAAILDVMLPQLFASQLYQAVLEASASEHSSRMLAMRNASDSAGDMIDDLTFTFNQARQAGITREIAEISAGKAVLE